MKNINDYIEENNSYKHQIRKLRINRLFARSANVILRFLRLLIYIVPVVVILNTFQNNRVIGAFIAIAVFYLTCKLLSYKNENKISKFINEFSNSNSGINIEILKMRINENNSIIKAAQDGIDVNS